MARIKLRSAGMRSMLRTDEVRDQVTDRAELVLEAARASAPVASGAYRDGLHLVQDTTDRAVVRVAGGTDHDLIVEANTGNLARALDAAGGKRGTVSLPLIGFDDLTLWATDYLRTALAARPEPYAGDVYVGATAPATAHDRVVTVRRDGGPRLDATREAARLGVNVRARTDQEAGDLARLVAALLWSAPDGRPVCKVTQTSGPSPVEDTRPRFYMTFELIARGANL